MTDAILSNREGGILTLTFHRLDKKNAITRAMYTAMAEALEAAAADDTVRVAVIRTVPPSGWGAMPCRIAFSTRLRTARNKASGWPCTQTALSAPVSAISAEANKKAGKVCAILLATYSSRH